MKRSSEEAGLDAAPPAKAARSGDAALTPEPSAAQKRALELALKTKDNLFITGGAGVGKTAVLSWILDALRSQGEPYLYVTGSTGLAATDLGGTTLNKFAGLTTESRLSQAAGVIKRLTAQTAKKWEREALTRWRLARTLVIDEISMVSADKMDMLHAIACALRRKTTDEPMGNIRVIICGDFFQLPPVTAHSEELHYAFEAKVWKHMKWRVVLLTESFRQADDQPYLNMLNEIRRGIVSDATRAALESRVRFQHTPVAQGGRPVSVIMPHNRDVDATNNQRLAQGTGTMRIYAGYDFTAEPGHAALLKDVRVPLNLTLRVGAQVMLLKNLSTASGLVNGSVGTVVSFGGFNPNRDYQSQVDELMQHLRDLPYADKLDEEELEARLAKKIAAKHKEEKVWVRFGKGAGLHDDAACIEPARWTFNDPSKKDVVLAERTQIPLALAWAMSVHKSQGQTITSPVETDLNTMFEYGQAYVVLSRVKSLQQLSLRGFNVNKIRAHPRVIDFYTNLEAEYHRQLTS